jgi:TDG/mug DNA glycosylase family protein
VKKEGGEPMFVSSFPPLVDSGSHTLILGSMPGVESLRQGRYYAHPRNHFWPLVYGAYGFQAEEDWEERFRFIQSRGIALWDVPGHCERPGSLDADIRNPDPNDFGALFIQYPNIRRLFFNGKASYQLFEKQAAPYLDLSGHSLVKLPSSSPAHAIPLSRKLEAWRVIAEA